MSSPISPAERPPSPRRRRAGDRLLAAALAAGYFALLLATMDIGFARDEGYYFKAGELYSHWFDELGAAVKAGHPGRAFSRTVIDRHFSYNPEHPALPKLLFGLSWRLFGRMQPPGVPPAEARPLYRDGAQPRPWLGVLPEAVAFRLPGALAAALLVAAIYLFGARAFGRRAGLAAALAFCAMPRAWFDAHLAAFDIPIALMWFLTVAAFRRSLDGGWRWALATGVVFGLALSTKHNAWFLPLDCGLIALLLAWRQLRLRPTTPVGAGLTLPPLPLSLAAMAVVGPLLAWALWPRLWFDTVSRVLWYFGRHLHHEYYWAYFFGTLYTKPPFPWYFPWVMVLVTVPLVTLALAGLGGRQLFAPCGCAAGETDPEARRRTRIVLLVNVLLPIAVFSTTRTPIFGGTKHWLPAMPYLALLAGLGFDRLATGLQAWLAARRPSQPSTRLVRWAPAALGALLFFPAAWEVGHAHPDSSSYYNALLGGLPGMAEHGMQREFWGNSARRVLPWLNTHLPPNARVYFQDTNDDSVLLYKRDGLLRRDIVAVDDWSQADWTLFHHHKEFLDQEFQYRLDYGDDKPVAGVYQDGVPLLEVYHNRARWRDR